MTYTLTFETILPDVGTCRVSGFTGTPVDVVVPAEFEGRAVVEIGAEAFRGSISLTSISLPEGLTSIRTAAFQGCANLAEAALPESLVSLESSVFRSCTNLQSISLPDGIDVLFFASFAFCTNLINVKLPANLTSVGSSIFSFCSSLASISIPAGLTGIGAGMFSSCVSLARIEFLGSKPTFSTNCFSDGDGGAIPATAYILRDATGWPTPPAGVGDPLIPTAYIPEFATVLPKVL